MPLLADQICFRQPCPEVHVDLAGMAQAKDVHMVAGRDGLDPAKARVLKSSREHDVSVQPLLPRRRSREGHPDLKGDAGLLRQDPNWADTSDRRYNLVEEGSNLWRFSPEMISETIAAARMRSVSVREVTSAAFATP